jgi:type I restriction enzyme R subunit
VRKILDRIREVHKDNTRQGGVVWHTQGSGKSLTMVMLAQGLALEEGLDNFKIILVTDRVDLDDQIYKTFSHCAAEPLQARTGRHLSELIGDHKQRIITTVIDKFEAAVGKNAVRNDNPNIFVLVDEGHRGQYGELHAKMRKVLPCEYALSRQLAGHALQGAARGPGQVYSAAVQALPGRVWHGARGGAHLTTG